MGIGSALATATLQYRKSKRDGLWNIELVVWNRSYDDPESARRNSLITGVHLVDLPQSTGYQMPTQTITDRNGSDVTALWTKEFGFLSAGFNGYTEYDTAGQCGQSLPSVFWSCFTGIYDDRCLYDPACDGHRLRTYRPTMPQIGVFNYLVGPVAFRFSISPFSPNKGVKVQITTQFIGGDGGNPNSHGNVAQQEKFIIEFV
jgi:hypothetical protein